MSNLARVSNEAPCRFNNLDAVNRDRAAKIGNFGTGGKSSGDIPEDSGHWYCSYYNMGVNAYNQAMDYWNQFNNLGFNVDTDNKQLTFTTGNWTIGLGEVKLDYNFGPTPGTYDFGYGKKGSGVTVKIKF